MTTVWPLSTMPPQVAAEALRGRGVASPMPTSDAEPGADEPDEDRLEQHRGEHLAPARRRRPGAGPAPACAAAR